MVSADRLYGITMQEQGVSKVLTINLNDMAKELKISALTVKKAYDNLEEEGFTVTVHGKGTYVAATNKNLMREEQLKEVEHDLEQAIMKGRRCGLNDEEIRNLFEMIMED